MIRDFSPNSERQREIPPSAAFPSFSRTFPFSLGNDFPGISKMSRCASPDALERVTLTSEGKRGPLFSAERFSGNARAARRENRENDENAGEDFLFFHAKVISEKNNSLFCAMRESCHFEGGGAGNLNDRGAICRGATAKFEMVLKKDGK